MSNFAEPKIRISEIGGRKIVVIGDIQLPVICVRIMYVYLGEINNLNPMFWCGLHCKLQHVLYSEHSTGPILFRFLTPAALHLQNAEIPIVQKAMSREREVSGASLPFDNRSHISLAQMNATHPSLRFLCFESVAPLMDFPLKTSFSC